MADGSKHPPGKLAEELIIVRRMAPEDAGAKGGAWKIAYADFVTAMMAFFLVMWLINAANEKTKAQVASYFNPIKLVDNTTSAKGVKTPGDRTAAGKEITITRADKDTFSKSEESKEAAPEEKKTEETKDAPAAEKQGEAKEKPSRQEDNAAPAEARAADAAQGSAGASEAELFADPYKLLAQLAGQAPGGVEGKSEKRMVIIEQTEPGKPGGPAIRDPFDPLAWKMVPPAPPPAEGKPPEAPRKPAKDEVPTPPAAVKPSAEAAKTEAVETAVKEAETIRSALREELAQLGGKHPDLQVKTTKEGVLISLTDSVSFDMFDVGSAKPRPVVVKLMEKVAAAVKQFKGHIVVRGHTDARPYRGNGYDNWRLSMARAQMAYYMLIRAGVDDANVERIEGYADKALLRRDEPESAENRRIEILLKVAEP